MKPKWLEQLDEGRQGRGRSYVLSGNTADKIHYPESGIPPIPLKYFLAAYLSAEGYETGVYSLANGFEELRPPRQPNGVAAASPFTSLPAGLPPAQVLTHMTRWLRNAEHRVALVLDYGEHLAPSSGGMNAVVGQMQLALLEVLHSWGVDENIRRTRNLVFLVSYDNQVNELLLQSGSGFKVLNIPLPGQDARADFVKFLEGTPSLRTVDSGAFGVGELGRITSGLPLIEIEELFHVSATRPGSLTHGFIRDRKASVISQLCRGLLEVHEPTSGFEHVSGLEHAKQELRQVVRSFRTDPNTATQAILFAGVPGCGKSFLVRAVAKELGLPCLAMRNVREGLVGASERNLDRVLWVAETLAPCVMWIDEIDQQMGQRTTGQTMDAGVSERMTARIWEFMGSMKHRGQILWVGTSNRPDILDSALLDRFQLVIPFLHPSPQEVGLLLPELAHQLGRRLGDDVDAQEIAKEPSLRQPTVRALQEVVARAGMLTDADVGVAGHPIDQTHLLEAVRDYKPNYNPIQHQFVALSAIRMASFSSVLPWRDRHGLRAGADIPAYLQGIVDPASGAVDADRLGERLRILSDLLQHEQRQRQF